MVDFGNQCSLLLFIWRRSPFSVSPLITPSNSVWFACHQLNKIKNRYELIRKNDLIKFQPLIYCFDMNRVIEKIGKRFCDLRILPKEFLRPNRQSAGILVYLIEFHCIYHLFLLVIFVLM